MKDKNLLTSARRPQQVLLILSWMPSFHATTLFPKCLTFLFRRCFSQIVALAFGTSLPQYIWKQLFQHRQRITDEFIIILPWLSFKVFQSPRCIFLSTSESCCITKESLVHLMRSQIVPSDTRLRRSSLWFSSTGQFGLLVARYRSSSSQGGWDTLLFPCSWAELKWCLSCSKTYLLSV